MTLAQALRTAEDVAQALDRVFAPKPDLPNNQKDI